MAAAVTNLKRLLLVCGNRKVFIITPGLWYVIAAFCNSNEHCLQKRFPDFALKLQNDLHLTNNLLASTKATPPMLPSGSVKRPRSE
jgi:hypothetical protein